MNLFFDFIVDKEKKAIYIAREFAADRDVIWDAFTKAEILEKWSAPKPFRAKITEMDFRKGGRCVTEMIAPDNTSRWSLSEYMQIDPKSSFTARMSFVDGQGKPLNNGYSITTTSFEPGAGTTLVRMEKLFDELSTIETMIAGGYKDGLIRWMDNLDEYLKLVTI